MTLTARLGTSPTAIFRMVRIRPGRRTELAWASKAMRMLLRKTTGLMLPIVALSTHTILVRGAKLPVPSILLGSLEQKRLALGMCPKIGWALRLTCGRSEWGVK